MNTGVTLIEVRNEAMDAIRKLKNKEMDTQTAKEIRALLDTIVSTAKTQVDFLNALPKQVRDEIQLPEIKAIAGTLRDRDAELDATLDEIENNKKQTYKIQSHAHNNF